MDNSRYVKDYKIISPGHPPMILRYWMTSFQWIVFFENEANCLATHDGTARTAVEALEKFIKYRINGEREYPADHPFVYDNGSFAGGT